MIRVKNVSLEMRRADLNANIATGSDSSIVVALNSTLNMADGSFTQNKAGMGGAIRLSEFSSLEVNDTEFNSNTAQ